MRTNVDAATLVDPIRRLVTSGRSDLPFLSVRPYSGLLERQMRPWRLGTILLSLFGALALGVAAMGLYAAFTHVVHERRHEMAIRLSVGATPSNVLTLILREAATLAVVGIVFGSLAAILAGRWVESMWFGTAPWDPLVLGGAGLVMLVVATTATLLPARSAARTDPNALLRAE